MSSPSLTTNPELAALQQQNVGIRTKLFEQKEEISRLKGIIASQDKHQCDVDSTLAELRSQWETLTRELSVTLTETGLVDPIAHLEQLPTRPPDDYVNFFQRLCTSPFPESLSQVPSNFKELLSPTYSLLASLLAAVRTLVSQRDSQCSNLSAEQIDRTSHLESIVSQLRTRCAQLEATNTKKTDTEAELKSIILKKDQILLEKDNQLEELGRRLAKIVEDNNKLSEQNLKMESDLEALKAEVERCNQTDFELRRKLETFSAGGGPADVDLIAEVADLKAKLSTRSNTITDLQRENTSLREQLASQTTVSLDDKSVRRSQLWTRTYDKFLRVANKSKELETTKANLIHSLTTWTQNSKDQVHMATRHADARAASIQQQLTKAQDEIFSLSKVIDEYKAKEELNHDADISELTGSNVVKEQQILIEELKNRLEQVNKREFRSERKETGDSELDELMLELDDVASQLSKMIDQNSRLISQLKDKDDANTKLLQARHDLKTQINALKRCFLEYKREADAARIRTEAAEEALKAAEQLREKEALETKQLVFSLSQSDAAAKSATSAQDKELAQLLKAREEIDSLHDKLNQLESHKKKLAEETSQLETALHFADEQNQLLRKKLQSVGLGGEAEEGEIELVEEPSVQRDVSHVVTNLEEERDALYQRIKCFCRINDKEVVLSKCGHSTCRNCIEERLHRRERRCPVCNLSFTKSDVVSLYLS
ncbi:hypothetical protein P9112_002269 [Eukaryota sp. TZLM1-RC]